MTKKKNTGFSMVEILISVAIFAILMIPIVSGIISSLRMTTESKELQYRNEFAEQMMEHIKSVSIEDITDKEYYVNNGTLDSSFNFSKTMNDSSVDLDGDGVVGPSETLQQTDYVLTGTTFLGTKHDPYSYRVEVSNQYYVDKKISNPTFIDPNNLALGIVEDIDYTKVALIDGTILNYDNAATTAFETKKLQHLREIDETRYWQQLAGTDVDLFETDKGYRIIRIQVSGDKKSGYTVRCILDYMDTSRYLPDNNYMYYTPYAQTFKELPNIYLMYNPCYYNQGYTGNDYIVLDTSEMEDDPEVNLFLVEIAETYSDKLSASGALGEDVSTDPLYRADVQNGIRRDDTVIHMAAVVKNKSDLNNIKVYHNIGDNAVTNSKTDRSKFWYKETGLISSEDKSNGMSAPVDSILEQMENLINDGVDPDKRKSFQALQADGSNGAYVGALNTATDENRGLYQVKIWLKNQADGAINTTTDQPILQGTKGGNELDK